MKDEDLRTYLQGMAERLEREHEIAEAPLLIEPLKEDHSTGQKTAAHSDLC